MEKTKIFLAFFTITGVLLLSGCGLKSSGPTRHPIKLEVWGLFDDSDVYNEIFDAYQKNNPNVLGITYKKFVPDTYQKELVEALASGQGPDVFLIHNTWLPAFADKIVPAPANVLTEQKFRREFVDVAAMDFIDTGRIYAVPLSVDTLGLYYNRDLFNQAGITAPPKNWNEFVDATKRMTRINSVGQIVQSGAAMGTAYNINRSTDILNLLMLQGNTPMLDDRQSRAMFDQFVQNDNTTSFPGENALNFYTQFAKANSSFYSWNGNMHYSIDAFSENNLGMMLNYSWQIPVIQSKSPKLNFAVAQVPQLDEVHPVNYPNYWAYTVAKNKRAIAAAVGNAQATAIPDDVRIEETWKFLKFLTTKPDVNPNDPNVPSYDAAAKYMQTTGKPGARKDIIEYQKTDPNIGIFAQQNLVAKSWRQKDPVSIEAIFAGMIDKVNKGYAIPGDAIKAAAQQVTQVMNR